MQIQKERRKAEKKYVRWRKEYKNIVEKKWTERRGIN
jgi:hypothetical protein